MRRLLAVLAAATLAVVAPGSEVAGAPSSAPVMYLTFDDGPNPLITPIVLRTLERHGAQATFFPTGRTLDLFWGDEEVQDLLDRGHAIGNHTWSHPTLSTLWWTEVRDQFIRGGAAVRERTGFEPSCARVPYGEQDPGITAVLDDLGLAIVDWQADPQEWRSPSREEALAHVQRWEEDGMVVLLHDRKWQTLGILEAILKHYGDRGWVFPPLPECRTDDEAAMRSAVRVAGDSPIGGFEFPRSGPRRLSGWAYDPDRPEGGLEVSVSVDGHSFETLRTGPDQGFSSSLPHTVGRVCIWVGNEGLPREDAFLGCRTPPWLLD